ncbi:MAG: hypothetical protein HUU20_23065 [Pirellulales bacterium]|nr:hypothetical protein [Pirellulales bacterium]
MEERYRERLARYTTAMRNEQPDCVPIRPFVAEFTGTYAGYTCQQLAHDYENAFAAARKCAADFDWDAVVPNMLATWTGMTQALGLRYYMVPGIDLPPNVGHQYREPPPEQAWMRPDEYDALVEDPTGYLYNVWLPRVARPLSPAGGPVTLAHNVALVKCAMAMMQFFHAWAVQEERLRNESGTVSAIAGMLRAPMDFIADKLRGYLGLVDDLFERPQKVLAACEALMPHLAHFALATADPGRNVPIGFWMHRGCVPFISPRTYDSHFWPTLKPIVEEFWKHGHQTLFYAEGKWRHHWETFRELPDRSIVYHCDQDDIFACHEALHDKFALSGGVPNMLLSYGTPGEVREFCRRVIREVAAEGGYLADAGAIMQDDTNIENLRAFTEVFREEGVYAAGSYADPTPLPPCELETSLASRRAVAGLEGRPAPRIAPGICFPWEEKEKELPGISGDKEMVRRVWNEIEGLANTYIWQLLLSF